jgi:hypothetical protein
MKGVGMPRWAEPIMEPILEKCVCLSIQSRWASLEWGNLGTGRNHFLALGLHGLCRSEQEMVSGKRGGS